MSDQGVLAICSTSSVSAARQAAESGARVVRWGGAGAGWDGFAFRDTTDVLSALAWAEIDEIAIRWARDFGRRPLVDGRSFHELAQRGGPSLWWLAELYLFHSTQAPAHVRTIEIFRRVLQGEGAREVEAHGLLPLERVLLARTASAVGVLFPGEAPVPQRALARATHRQQRLCHLDVLKTAGTALKAALAGLPKTATGAPLALSHAAFWRERKAAEGTVLREHYFDTVLPELAARGQEATVVAVGPKEAHRRRTPVSRLSDWLRVRPARLPYLAIDRWCDRHVVGAAWRGARDMRTLWRVLAHAPGTADAFSHAGVRFADLSGPDLAGVMLRQLPWAIRTQALLSRVLATLQPSVVCLYSESSDWGRLVLAAARAQGVPTVALQHGILYPTYFSYRHDRGDDCPRPDRTAVFGAEARRLLVEIGAYDPATLVPTGSPKFDALAEQAKSLDVSAVRRDLGLAPGDRLLVLASRYRPIRDTHESVGTAFPALVQAVEGLPGTWLVVKPHPAEPAADYEADVRRMGATRIKVLPPTADLLPLLVACDALVTVESFAALEALVVERPVVLLNQPSNQRSLVDAGVALGVAAGTTPGPALQAVLEDMETVEMLAAARARWLHEFALGADGGATARIVDLILETARPAAGAFPADPG